MLAPSARMQELALRFNLLPATFADRAWWPRGLAKVFADERALSAAASAELSAWLLRRYHLLDQYDFDFSQPIRRIWLLPRYMLVVLATRVGVLCYRDHIRQCVSGRSVARLKQALGEPLLTYALATASARIPAELTRRPSANARVGVSDCLVAGARALLTTLSPASRALTHRAILTFPPVVCREPLRLNEPAQQRIRVAVMHCTSTMEPQWRWLFS